MAARCGSMIIMPRSISVASRGSSKAIAPRAQRRRAELSMAFARSQNRILVEACRDLREVCAFTEHEPVDR
jgi:hypothetical protein